MILVDVTNVVVVANVEIAVLLKEHEGERSLPIFVAPLEANSIAAQLNNEKFPRPLTHDLFKNVLDRLDCSLIRVEVCDLVDNTFIGKLVLQRDDATMEIDSRPSDAISLAIRFGAPVYVEDKVMEEAGKLIEEVKPEADEKSQPEEPKPDVPIRPKAKAEELKQSLEKAVQEERYEDAAKLRDEIGKAGKMGSAN